MKTTQKRVAIKIKNPEKIRALFGAEAGDFSRDNLGWWVGSPKELLPSSGLPDDAVVINAPVKFCGAQAWVEHPPRRGYDVGNKILYGHTPLLGSGYIYNHHAKRGYKDTARYLLGAQRRLFPAPRLP